MRFLAIFLTLALTSFVVFAQPAPDGQPPAAPATTVSPGGEIQPAISIWKDVDFWRAFGPIIAAFIGFMGGTVVNHLLDIRRQDRDRQFNKDVLSAAIAGELRANRRSLKAAIRMTERRIHEFEQKGSIKEGCWIITPLEVKTLNDIYKSNIDKMGILGRDVVANIALVYYAIAIEGDSPDLQTAETSSPEALEELRSIRNAHQASVDLIDDVLRRMNEA